MNLKPPTDGASDVEEFKVTSRLSYNRKVSFVYDGHVLKY
jgi:hypothetical protein